MCYPLDRAWPYAPFLISYIISPENSRCQIWGKMTIYIWNFFSGTVFNVPNSKYVNPCNRALGEESKKEIFMSIKTFLEKTKTTITSADSHKQPDNKMNMLTCDIINALFRQDNKNLCIDKDQGDTNKVSIRALIGWGDKKEVDDMGLSDVIPKLINVYDNEVFNGICSLADAGRYSFTDHELYRVITGKPVSSNVSSSALEEVGNSISKMQSILLSIDWTECAKMNGTNNSNINNIVTRSNMLSIKRVPITMPNGTSTVGYKLLEEPDLYRYVKIMCQINSVNINVLQVPGVNYTKRSTVIKSYLARKIEAAKNDKDFCASTEIHIDDLFDSCQIGSVSRKVKADIINTITTILSYWVRCGYVKRYNKILGSRGEVLKINITL